MGDTLSATLRGFSTLSGTSQLCSWFENSAKYRQICKADLRRSHKSPGVVSGTDSMGEALSQRTKPLLQAHSARIGVAANNACGRINQISTPNPIARRGIQSM